MPFLPITREEMKERGIEQFDFVYVIGDAYVDHSSFGPAIISRVLEANGYIRFTFYQGSLHQVGGIDYLNG